MGDLTDNSGFAYRLLCLLDVSVCKNLHTKYRISLNTRRLRIQADSLFPTGVLKKNSDNLETNNRNFSENSERDI
jgi:hypothetical protein